MAENSEHYNRHSTGPYSTLEAVHHHPELVSPTSPAPTYSTLEVSPKVDQGRFSTPIKASPTADKGRFSAYGSSPPTSPKFDEGRFSTLEAYQHPDEPITPAKTEGGLGADGTESEPKKENWKRKRVCGIPLLFLVIGLVVVLAAIGAIVGGVVGSRKKNDTKPEATPTVAESGTRIAGPKPGNTKAVTTQTSQAYFNSTPYYPIEYHFLVDLKGIQHRLEDSIPHGRTPDDGVFVGKVENNGYQQWDLTNVPEDKRPSTPEPDKALFWLRLQETDLVLQLNDEVVETIIGTKTNSSRNDVPLQLKAFNPDDTNQMWWLGAEDKEVKKDSIHNVRLWDVNWTMGIGSDNTVRMLRDSPDEGKIWRLFHLTPLPWEVTK